MPELALSIGPQKFDASVKGTPVEGRIVALGLGFSKAARLQSARLNTLLNQCGSNGCRTVRRQFLVVASVANRVGVPVDLQRPCWIIFQSRRYIFDELCRFRPERRLVKIEMQAIDVIFSQRAERLLHCRLHRRARRNPHDALRTQLLLPAELECALNHHGVVLVVEEIEVSYSGLAS